MILGARHPPAGGLPHLIGGLARLRDHAGHEDEAIRAGLVGDDGSDIASPGLADDDDLLAVGERLDRVENDPRMVRERGVVILDRQVGRDGLVAARTELALDEMPVPANVTGAVDQGVRRHGGIRSKVRADIRLTCNANRY